MRKTNPVRLAGKHGLTQTDMNDTDEQGSEMDDVDAMDGRGQAMDGGRRRTATERRDYKGERVPLYVSAKRTHRFLAGFLLQVTMNKCFAQKICERNRWFVLENEPTGEVFGVVSGEKWVRFRKTRPVAADDRGV